MARRPHETDPELSVTVVEDTTMRRPGRVYRPLSAVHAAVDRALGGMETTTETQLALLRGPQQIAASMGLTNESAGLTGHTLPEGWFYAELFVRVADAPALISAIEKNNLGFAPTVVVRPREDGTIALPLITSEANIQNLSYLIGKSRAELPFTLVKSTAEDAASFLYLRNRGILPLSRSPRIRQNIVLPSRQMLVAYSNDEIVSAEAVEPRFFTAEERAFPTYGASGQSVLFAKSQPREPQHPRSDHPTRALFIDLQSVGYRDERARRAIEFYFGRGGRSGSLRAFAYDGGLMVTTHSPTGNDHLFEVAAQLAAVGVGSLVAPCRPRSILHSRLSLEGFPDRDRVSGVRQQLPAPERGILAMKSHLNAMRSGKTRDGALITLTARSTTDADFEEVLDVTSGVREHPQGPEFVDFNGELRKLLTRFSSSDTGFIFLMGDPGMGKTRALQEVRAKCKETFAMTSFVEEDLMEFGRGYIRIVSELATQLRRKFTKPTLAPLSVRKFMEFDAIPFEKKLSSYFGPQHATHRIALQQLLSNAIVDGELHFGVDNLHYSDDSGAIVCAAMLEAHRQIEGRFKMVLAMREGYDQVAFLDVLEAKVGKNGVSKHHLNRVDFEAQLSSAKQLAANTFTFGGRNEFSHANLHDGWVRGVARASGGVPLHFIEHIRELADRKIFELEEGPLGATVVVGEQHRAQVEAFTGEGDFAQTLYENLERLSREERILLTCLSLLGEEAVSEPKVVQIGRDVMHREEDDVLAMLESLVASRRLERCEHEDGSPAAYGFRHDALRAFIAQQLVRHDPRHLTTLAKALAEAKLGVGQMHLYEHIARAAGSPEEVPWEEMLTGFRGEIADHKKGRYVEKLLARALRLAALPNLAKTSTGRDAAELLKEALMIIAEYGATHGKVADSQRAAALLHSLPATSATDLTKLDLINFFNTVFDAQKQDRDAQTLLEAHHRLDDFRMDHLQRALVDMRTYYRLASDDKLPHQDRTSYTNAFLDSYRTIYPRLETYDDKHRMQHEGAPHPDVCEINRLYLRFRLSQIRWARTCMPGSDKPLDGDLQFAALSNMQEVSIAGDPRPCKDVLRETAQYTKQLGIQMEGNPSLFEPLQQIALLEQLGLCAALEGGFEEAIRQFRTMTIEAGRHGYHDLAVRGAKFHGDVHFEEARRATSIGARKDCLEQALKVYEVEMKNALANAPDPGEAARWHTQIIQTLGRLARLVTERAEYAFGQKPWPEGRKPNDAMLGHIRAQLIEQAQQLFEKGTRHLREMQQIEGKTGKMGDAVARTPDRPFFALVSYYALSGLGDLLKAADTTGSMVNKEGIKKTSMLQPQVIAAAEAYGESLFLETDEQGPKMAALRSIPRSLLIRMDGVS